MRRRVLTILALLVAGAVVNVAVAWGCASRSIQRSWTISAREGYSRIESVGFWRVFGTDSFGRVRIRSWWAFEWSGGITVNLNLPAARDLLPKWTDVVDHLEPGDINNADVVAEATGWPFLAMFAHYELAPGEPDQSGKYFFPIRSPRGIVISDAGDLCLLILPTRIIWPGFAINTILYAVVLWLLIPGPFALRRLVRRRRGLCPACTYPMGESPTCTECGRDLPARSEAVT